MRDILFRSLLLAILTTVICLVVAYPFAYFAATVAPRWRNLMIVLVMIPFWTNFLVRNYAWRVILGTNGPMSDLSSLVGLGETRLLFTQWAVVLGMVYGFLPFMILPLHASIERIDGRLLEASRDLYATPWQSFRHVLLPLSIPGIIGGSILTFVPGLGAYVTPAILGGAKTTLLGSYIVTQFQGGPRLALRIGAVGRADPGDAVVDHRLLPSGRGDVVSGLAAPRGNTRRALQCNVALIFVFFYVPTLLLVLFSFSDTTTVGDWGGFTFRWYSEFAGDRATKDALQASLQTAFVATAVSVVLGTTSALALERFRFRGRRVFDAMTYLPLIVPDVTMAIMLLLFFSEASNLLGVSRGFTTITMAHIAFSISIVSVVVRARLGGSSDVLEEAARDLYASRWQAFRHVTLPIMMPASSAAHCLPSRSQATTW